MACTSPPPQMPHRASKKGGRSGHGLRFRRGAAAPEAMVQPQSGQRHTKLRTRTSAKGFHAHAPRFHMCASGSASGAPNTDSESLLPARRTAGSSAGRSDGSSLARSSERWPRGVSVSDPQGVQGRMPDRYGPHGMTPTARLEHVALPRPVHTPALIATVHGVPAGRSAIRCCRTAAPVHRNLPRSLGVRSCGSSSSRSPSAAPPKAGRCARTSCTRGRVLDWQPTPTYCQPPRPRSSCRISRQLPIDDSAPLKSSCAPLALKAACPSCFRDAVSMLPCPRVNPPSRHGPADLGNRPPFLVGHARKHGGLRLQSRSIAAAPTPRPRETQADEPPSEPS